MAYNIAKCRYEKTFEDGKHKIVTEQYLIDGLSVTECESRAVEELTPLYPDIEVKDVVSTKISEVMGDKECGRFWLVKVAFITIDEKTAAGKRTVSQILVGAMDFDSAVESFKGGMKNTMSNWEIISVAETPYMGVYPANLGGA